MSQRPTILLMDGDAETLEQLQTALSREHYQVLAAVDGDAALRLARMAKPNLIISDLLLEGLDSYEVWKMLRTDATTAHIPILVVSALDIPSSNQPWRPTPDTEWQLLSYDTFLPKPIDLPRFVRVVEKILYPNRADQIPGGPSVLLAIEDEAVQTCLSELLQEHDFGVKVSPTLADALRTVRAVPPAALILDYRIPSENLKAQIIRLNTLVPTTITILIIDREKELDADLQGHYDGLLTLPLHPTHTIMQLDGILDLHGMSRRTQALSTNLIITNRNLHDTELRLNAQNSELQHVNMRLRELDSLKEMLNSMVVHDLKAPMASILGVLNFFQMNAPADPVHQSLLDGSVAAGHQMLRLIETLLEQQRLQDGKLRPDNEPVNIENIVDMCVQQISPLLTLHHLDVVQDIPADLPLVYADPGISQRVLENLLDNAIKFSPRDSSITITAKTHRQYITISVIDTGPGIPKEQQQKIFDRFSQLENAKLSDRSSFGLGLTFCSLAVQTMEGTIWVESDGVSGTTFSFTLPIYKEA